MGASERRELLNRLQILVMHLLKYPYPPERRGKRGKLTIVHQRTAVERLLKPSPSLMHVLANPEEVQDVYRKAVAEAVLETDPDRSVFPVECPYGVADMLADGFWPEWPDRPAVPASPTPALQTLENLSSECGYHP